MNSTERWAAWAAAMCLLMLGLAGAGCARTSAHSDMAAKSRQAAGDKTAEPTPGGQTPLAQETTSAPDTASTPDDPSAPAVGSNPVRAEPVELPATPAASHATAVEVPKPTPPPADRGPVRPGDAEKITFDDLNLGMQADIVFRPFMISDRVNELAGKRVSIVGYMHGGQETQRGITKFILLKNTQCKFGPGGQADHLTDVHLRDGVTTNLTTSPLKVEGTLRIEPFEGNDGNTWSIYRLENAQIR